jgi:hypothetical protein
MRSVEHSAHVPTSEDHDLTRPTATPVAAPSGPGGPLVIAVVAVAVAAIAVGATIALSGGDPAGGTPGAQQRPTSSQVDRLPGHEGQADPATTLPDPDMPLGPDGLPMVDGTVTSGPLFEEAARLLAELVAVVPAGYTVPATDSTIFGPGMEGREPTPEDFRAERSHRTHWLQKTDGVDVWMTEAVVAVSAGPGTGTLSLTVLTPGGPEQEGMCEQFDADPEGECRLVDVGGREVMLLGMGNGSLSVEQARYTHPDGTIVSFTQTLSGLGGDPNSLPRHVFTVQELAALAVDARFHTTP